jgi:deaminated glutathione amidase
VTGVGPIQGAAGEVSLTVLQLAATLDWRRNLETLTRLARSAPEADQPRLMLAPEAAMCDFGPPSFDLTEAAQPLDGPFVAGLVQLARTTRSTLVAGMLEAPGADADAGRVFNTVVALGPDGDLRARYRKVHLYDAFGYCESDRIASGSDPRVTFEFGGVTFGLMTCYDLRFAEQAVGLAESGSEVLLLPAAWLAGPQKADHWRTLAHARAIETTCYLAGAGQGGEHYVGESAVIDPMGLDLTEPIARDDGIRTATVSAARVAEVRRVNPTLANRLSTRGEAARP